MASQSRRKAPAPLIADRDLSTPAHDAIMLWLQGNLATVIPQVLERWRAPGEVEWPADQTRNLKTIPEHPGNRISRVTWEYPIIRPGGFIVGYIDMLVEVESPFLSMGRDRKPVIQWEGGTSDDPTGVLFEVKSRITSIGEVIRQIRAYETVHKSAYFCIVCPDDRFADVIRGQRIAFVKSPRVSLANTGV